MYGKSFLLVNLSTRGPEINNVITEKIAFSWKHNTVTGHPLQIGYDFLTKELKNLLNRFQDPTTRLNRIFDPLIPPESHPFQPTFKIKK